MNTEPFNAVTENRPRPYPGYRVAPPVTDAFAPWVSVLDHELAVNQFEWVLTDDALVPVTLTEDELTVRPKRSRWSRHPR